MKKYLRLSLLILLPFFFHQNIILADDQVNSKITWPVKENYGISEEDMEDVRTNRMKVENNILNPKVAVSLDTGIKYEYYWLTSDKTILKNGSTPVRGAYDDGRLDLKLKFSYALRGGKMSMELGYYVSPDNTDTPDYGLNIGYPYFSAALGKVSYNVYAGLGDLKYIINSATVNRPLLTGDFSSFHDNLLQFQYLYLRVPWVEVKDPEPMYRTVFENVSSIPSDPVQQSLNQSGIGIEFKAPGDFNVGLMAVRYAFHPLIGITKNFGNLTFGAGYMLSTDDPDWSNIPVYQSHNFESSIIYNHSRFYLFLEGAYTKSLIREYYVTNFEYRNLGDRYDVSGPERSGLRETKTNGFALHATLVTKKGKFLMFKGNQFLLRYVFASDGFDPTENGIRDVNYKFKGIIKPIDPIREIEDFYYGAQTIYASDKFNFLKGTIRITGGLAKSSILTPDAYRLGNWFNNKVWHFTGAIYGADWYGPEGTGNQFKTDYKSVWQQDWNDTYEGSSTVVWSYYTCKLKYFQNSSGTWYSNTYRVPLYSKKAFSLFSVDYSLDISRLIRLPFPVYYYGRWQYSAITASNNLVSPFKPDGKNISVYYALSGHYLVFAVTRSFNILAYYGVEKNIHNPIKTTPVIPPWSKNDPLDTYPTFETLSFDSLAIKRTDTGYGFGFDWYFKEGFGFYFRFHTASQKDYIQNNTIRPYGLRFELRRFFSYS